MTFETLRRFSLRLRRRPSPAGSGLPLGLDPDQCQALSQWASHPAGRAWEVALNRLFDLQAEQLAGRLPHDDYLFQCGVVHALRVVANLPESLTHALEAQRARDTRSAAGNTTDHAGPGWDLNSPWFERGRPTGPR